MAWTLRRAGEAKAPDVMDKDQADERQVPISLHPKKSRLRNAGLATKTSKFVAGVGSEAGAGYCEALGVTRRWEP